MQCNHPANARLHPDPEERPRKRRRTEREENEASCASVRRESKRIYLKRKKTYVLHDTPGPDPKERPRKRRRTETEEEEQKAEKTKDISVPVVLSYTAASTRKLCNKQKREKKSGTQYGTRVNAFRNAKFHGRYTLEERLGFGGFGTVFAASRRTDGKKVAVKIVHKCQNELYMTLPGETRHVPSEVGLMGLVNRPPCSKNVIQLFDWLEDSRSFMFVLERPKHYIDLFMYCNWHHKNRLPESEVKTIIRQVICAVCHCHARGVVHRDIKEENILVNPKTLQVKLIDFGCSDVFKDTVYTEFAGTPVFTPPEWFTEHMYKAESSTVWSIGILIYSLLCGKVPFDNSSEILAGNLNIPVRVNKTTCNLIKQCLEVDQLKRIQLNDMLKHSWFNQSKKAL